MTKEAYENSVSRQVADLRTLAGVQAAKCFDLARLESVMDRGKAAGIKRILITGCGDSYSAAGAMVPGVKALSGIRRINSPDIMDFCRFYSDRKILAGFQPEEVLLVTISFSGSAKRVAEAMERAHGLGVGTLLITRTPDSLCGHLAKHVFNVDTPDGCNTPGLRSYFASLMGLAALGGYLGVCSGFITEERFAQAGASCASYVEDFLSDLETMDDKMFAEACRMKDLKKFEVIADGNEGYSAQFVEQKFIECGGVWCDHTTSEEFAHISYMLRTPAQVGMVVMINRGDKSLSRMKDTINGCLAQHRPTLIVTDGDPDLFKNDRDGDVGVVHKIYDLVFENKGGGVEPGVPTILTVAPAPESWMSPLADFIPGSLLAAYHAAVNEHKFFGGAYDFRTETWDQ